MIWNLWKTLFIFTLLCISSHLSAQDYLVNIRKFSDTDGLSHKQVNCILQGEDGFMWIGTKYGLNRFDGYTFQWFTKEKNKLSSNYVQELYQDDADWIWVVHSEESQGFFTYYSIDLLNPRTYEVRSFNSLSEESPPFDVENISSIFSLPDKRILFQLSSGKHFLFSQTAGFSALSFPPSFSIVSVAGQNQIWGSVEGQLLRIDLEGKILQSYSLPAGNVIKDLEIDPFGKIWAKGGLPYGNTNHTKEKKIWLLSKDSLVLQTPFASSTFDYAGIMSDPKRETVWLWSGQSLIGLDSTHEVAFQRPALLKENPLLFNDALIMDRNGVFWYGHRDGFWLIELQPSKFEHFLTTDGSKPANTRGIAAKGDFLYINSQLGSAAINLKTGEIGSYTGGNSRFDSFKCFPMIKTAKGEVWTANDRLYQLDGQGNIVKEIMVKETPSGRADRIFGFFQDQSGTFWIGMGAEEFYFFNPKRHQKPILFDRYNGFSDLQQAEKWHFLEDEKGIWIAAQNGLYLLDKERGIIARYGETESGNRYLPATQFFYIHKSKDQHYWFATGDGGLIRVAPEYFSENRTEANEQLIQQISRASGLPSNETYALIEDDYQHLWISTAKGLVQLDQQTLKFNAYFIEQGITHNEFNRLSYFQSDDSRIYFGGLNGVNAFDPDDFYNLPPYDAPLEITAVQILSGKTVDWTDISTSVKENGTIQYTPGDKFISVSVVLQDYFYSDKLTYQYRIDGFNDNWTTVEGNTIQLSSLPYGEYTLHIRGEGLDRRFSEDQLELQIQVLKPFFLQAWFLILAVLAIGLSIWQYYYWRIRSLRNRQNMLEQMVAERTAKIRSDKKVIEEQAEQLRELDEMKSRFFANISHELRTPLTLILGPLESVLNRNKLENRDYTLLKLMQQNGQQLLKRINELLDLSSLDAQKMEEEKEAVMLYPFLKKNLNQFESAANLKNIQLAFQYELDQHLQLLLDADKVEKILTNYLSNALKFTPGGEQIKLEAQRHEDQLRISVSDSGIGIPPDDLEKVFDRFYQSRQKENQGGTGIGLALCKELARLMNGNVWVDSAIDKGSTFFLQLPLTETFEQIAPSVEPATERAAAETQEETRLGPPPLKQAGTLLVVEDNPGLLEYMQVILSDYQIITATNGQVALEQLEHQRQNQAPVHLIISDIMMPVMDGIELLQTLKRSEAFRHIPVIMLTARQKLEQKLEALRIGVDDYMTKPFQEAELLARVGNLLANSQSRLSAAIPEGTRQAEAAPKPVSAADLKWLEEVEQLILDHIGNSQFSISWLADELALGTRRFQQKIKELTGLTPKEYQREIQLEKARRMLESGEYRSVSEVSYRIGFKDQHYFSSLFKKRFGKMPSELL